VSVVRLMELERWTHFVRDGRRCFLRDPGERATGRQLLALNARGHLAVVAESVEPLTKGEAAFAIDATKPRDPVYEEIPF
jgi:hypothetical protein